jgi:hypothetical protein
MLQDAEIALDRSFVDDEAGGRYARGIEGAEGVGSNRGCRRNWGQTPIFINHGSCLG